MFAAKRTEQNEARTHSVPAKYREPPTISRALQSCDTKFLRITIMRSQNALESCDHKITAKYQYVSIYIIEVQEAIKSLLVYQ